jgi:hypothetical protein
MHIKGIAYPATKLSICINGVEDTRWNHDSNKESTEKKKAYRLNVFFELKDTLATFEQARIEPGYYSFPYSF